MTITTILPSPSPRGCFITLEGIDGAGKSSHVSYLGDYLRQQGLTVHMTREPGGTAIGEKLRELVLHEAMSIETEALLMFAARQEHLQQVILPALARGEWVICDRFTDATFAYQGGGRGLDKRKIVALEHWVQGEIQPDLTFLFDLPCTEAQRRMQHSAREFDRFEQEQAQFHERVRASYLERAAQMPQRMQVIDGSQSIAHIRECLLVHLHSLPALQSTS